MQHVEKAIEAITEALPRECPKRELNDLMLPHL